MADKKLVELLAFNFASRTFAYLRLAQGLSRSRSSFSSSMREYLDRVIKADKCAQYVDDIGIATHNSEELKTNLREVFSVRPRSRFAFDNGQMPVRRQGSPIPRTNCVTRRNCSTRPEDSELLAKIDFPNAGANLLMTDANFKNAGYALMIEENAEEKITSVRKTCAPVAFGSKMFSTSQIKMSIYAKEFLAMYFAFMEYSHILWESTKPVVVLTDNKSVTRFSRQKSSLQPFGTRAILSSNSTSPLFTCREK